MKNDNFGLHTICTHTGEVEDQQFNGAVSPIYVSSSYAFEGVETLRYPRYFNTPNQEALGKKIAALEKTEAGLLFGSGMAAVSTCLFAFLRKGDHVVVQNAIYGGTFHLIKEQFDHFGIEYDFTEDLEIPSFQSKIKDNTKVIYIETPSNPLLRITDIEAIADLARKSNIISMIDNTFASPINQNPRALGIDIIIHSATKYLGGHSDILAGAVAASKVHIDSIFEMGIKLGGNLSDYTVWLLERSMKTLGLRVEAQNKNALSMANWLMDLEEIDRVYYPGLPSHPQYDLAKKQMRAFGGMLSFELNQELDAHAFMQALQLIKPSMSLAGVESTVLSPALTSHKLMGEEERAKQGIKDGLIRFSVGIENTEDLQADIKQALNAIK
ncbi:MAG: PLP-dependent aspartate aminotransferase family protein [Flavobacteriaceae bacterium]|nr:PLP-dependent aspartate aminotransferase family protein [Flavobacteriaceae bacterium]